MPKCKYIFFFRNLCTIHFIICCFNIFLKHKGNININKDENSIKTIFKFYLTSFHSHHTAIYHFNVRPLRNYFIK